MPFLLDVQYAMNDEILVSRGISRRALAESKNELLRVEKEFAEAVAQGVLPVFSDVGPKVRQAKDLAEQFAEFNEVWILGEAGVINSLQLCASESLPIRWINSMCPEDWNDITVEHKRLLVVLTGPRWVLEAAQVAKAMFDTVIQCIGDGTDVDKGIYIDGAEVIEEAGIADMRFALFSSLGLALQPDLDAAAAMLRKKTSEAQQTGLWENASSLLACCLFALDSKEHPSQMVMVGARSSWSKWMQWGADLWSGMSSQVYNTGTLNKRIDGRVHHFVLGDELGMNVLYSASSNTMVCLLNEQQPKIDEATDLTFAIWEMSHKMSNDLVTFTQQNALPLCICEVPKMTRIEVLGLCLGWVRSVLILNALRGVDPLTMWGADQWRMIEDSAK